MCALKRAVAGRISRLVLLIHSQELVLILVQIVIKDSTVQSDLLNSKLVSKATTVISKQHSLKNVLKVLTEQLQILLQLISAHHALVVTTVLKMVK